VRSTRFQVSREGSAFVLEGTGFGHGVGLCQAGALALLRDGRSVAQVLEHYYPGTAISTAPLQTLRMPDENGRATLFAESRNVPFLLPGPVRSDRGGR